MLCLIQSVGDRAPRTIQPTEDFDPIRTQEELDSNRPRYKTGDAERHLHTRNSACHPRAISAQG